MVPNASAAGSRMNPLKFQNYDQLSGLAEGEEILTVTAPKH